jgi:RNA polymerase sigma factor (sigma-70 family)
MSRLSQGEREAFDPLFRALYPRAVRLSRRKLAPDQAADVAQAIMMKVFARASEFEPGRPVLPWFYAVAANELHTATRRWAAEGRRSVEDDGTNELPDALDPEGLLAAEELREALTRAVASLDEESAEIIACVLEGRAPPKLAAPAFRKRVSRAYAKLRVLLGGHHAR